MQWDSTSKAGFCLENLEPWLPLSPGHETINVNSEESNPESVLNCYKALLKLRKNTPALHSGSLNLLPPFLFGNILSYQRIYNEQIVQIWLNFSKKSTYVSEIGKNPKLLFSTIVNTDSIKDTELHLEPYQGVVLEIFP